MAASGQAHATKGAWACVLLIVAGFVLGTLALILHSVPLWIATGVAFILGGVMALVSRIMEQVY